MIQLKIWTLNTDITQFSIIFSCFKGIVVFLKRGLILIDVHAEIVTDIKWHITSSLQNNTKCKGNGGRVRWNKIGHEWIDNH